MGFTIIDVPQRSPEWFAARLGRVTGSRAGDMLATRKDKKEAASRANLRVQLALERITGNSCERSYQSGDMQYGVETEGEALVVYQELTGNLLKSTGFIAHDELMAGTSLDGHVGEFEGLVEVKCPIPATHLEYIRTGTVPADYMAQVIHGLWLTGAAWCDWMSYAKEFPKHLRSKVVRIRLEDVDLSAYELLLRVFLREVEEEVKSITVMEVA